MLPRKFYTHDDIVYEVYFKIISDNARHESDHITGDFCCQLTVDM